MKVLCKSYKKGATAPVSHGEASVFDPVMGDDELISVFPPVLEGDDELISVFAPVLGDI